MVSVEDLENLDFGLEEAQSLGESETALSLVADVLRIIPLEVQEWDNRPLTCL